MAYTEAQIKEALGRQLRSGKITKEDATRKMQKFRSMQVAETLPETSVEELRYDQPIMTANAPVQETQPEATFSGQLDRQGPEAKLPEGSNLMANIKELFFADKRKIEEYESLPSFSEMPFYEASLFGVPLGVSEGLRREKAHLGSWAAGSSKEVADIFRNQLGKNPKTGKYPRQKTVGSYELIWNPHDEKWYADKPGFRVEDLKRLGGTLVTEAVVGKGLGLTKKISNVAKSLDKAMDSSVLGAAGREGAFQAGHEAVQELTGGQFSERDTSLAAGIGGVGRGVGKAIKSVVSSDANKKAIVKAHQGGDFNDLQRLHAENPESLNMSLKEYGLKEYDPQKGLVLEGDLDIAIQDLAKSKNKDKQQLANAMATDLEVVKAAKDEGILDLLTTREITSGKDFRTSELLDSIKTEGTKEGSMAGRMGHNQIELTERMIKKMDDINKSPDVGKMSAKIKSVMQSKKVDYEDKSDALYAELGKRIPKDLTFNAEKTLNYLDDRIDNFSRNTNKDGFSMLSKTEKDIYKLLRPEKGEVDLSTGVRVQDNAKYNTIDQLRKDVGSKIKALKVSDGDNADFKALYRTLTEDQDNAIASIGDMGGDAQAIWKEAKDLVKLRKGLEDDLGTLYGKQFDEDFVQRLGSAMQQTGKGSSHKFINMVNAVPKEERKNFVSSAILYSLNDKNGILEFDKFGNWWSKIKRNSTAMDFLSNPKNMNPEAFKLIKNLGTVSQAIHRTGKQTVEGVSPQMFKEVIEPKGQLMKKVIDSGMIAIGASGLSALAGLGLEGIGGVGGIAFSMSVLNGLKSTLSGAVEKRFKDTVDVIGSSDFKNFMASAGKTKDLRKLSASKKMQEWAKQAKIANNRTELEKWLTKSFRATSDVGKEEYQSDNQDLQQPQP